MPSVTIQPHNLPSTMSDQKTLNPTVEMLEYILAGLGFSGSWRLAQVERTRKKGNERFRPIRCERDGILIRCKPGGNDTAYLWQLNPLDVKLTGIAIVNPELILDRLRQINYKTLHIPKAGRGGLFAKPHAPLMGGLGARVPPINKKLFAFLTGPVSPEHHQPGESPLQRTIPIPVPSEPKEGCGYQDNQGHPCNKTIEEVIVLPNGQKAAACVEHVESALWKEIKWAAQNEDKLEAITKTKPRTKTPEVPMEVQVVAKPHDDEIIYDLKLDDSYLAKSLCENPNALDRALIAVAYVMKTDGSAGRVHVTGTLVNELGLIEFIEKSTIYRSTNSTIRSIIMGLCNESYIQRFQFRQKKKTRQKPGTEGYIITPHGRERISDLMEIMSPEIAKKLWGGPPSSEEDLLDVDVDEVDAEEDEDEEVVPEDGDELTQFNALEEAGVFSLIKPLIDEHDRLLKEVEQNVEFVKELQISEIEPQTDKLKSHDEEIKSLKSQLENLQKERDQCEKILLETKARLIEFDQERSGYQNRIVEIQNEIREKMSAR